MIRKISGVLPRISYQYQIPFFHNTRYITSSIQHTSVLILHEQRGVYNINTAAVEALSSQATRQATRPICRTAPYVQGWPALFAEYGSHWSRLAFRVRPPGCVLLENARQQIDGMYPVCTVLLYQVYSLTSSTPVLILHFALLK